MALTLFLLVSGVLFWHDFQPGQPAGMRHIFEHMVWMLVFIVPVLCMGLLAQEWATGTIETLMTAPVDETDVVVGKFLGSLGFFVVLLAPTLLYVVLLQAVRPHRTWGRSSAGTWASSWSGRCSSRRAVLLVADAQPGGGGGGAAAILFVITIVPWYVGRQGRRSAAFWRGVTDQGVFRRYADFAKGVIDTGNVVFFLVRDGRLPVPDRQGAGIAAVEVV